MTDPRLSLDNPLAQLLRRSRLAEPDELPRVIDRTAADFGAGKLRVYLADYQQRELRHLHHPNDAAEATIPIDGTMAGRAFRTQEAVRKADGETLQLWLPLINGTHRLGVMELWLDSGEGSADRWMPFVGLAADLIVTKARYGDGIPVTQRRREVALRAEAQRELLPPLTLETSRFVVAGILEPSYEVAGDIFDYAVNDDTLHLAIFDAMGHSLSATLTAAVAVSAYRNARRSGAALLERWGSAEQAVATEFGGEQFATAALAELDLVTGTLQTLSAGHPPLLVVRGHRVVATSGDVPTLPLGLGGQEPAVTDRQLQPDDQLLLFTDGIVEARSDAGEFFGEKRLVDYLARELDSGLPAAEALRRLVNAVVEHRRGHLRDDATLLLARWYGRHAT